MTEQIGIRITELISPIVPLSYSEAETESYPYAWYEQTPVYTYAKEGLAKISSDVRVTVVSNDFDEADGIASDIAESLTTNMRDGQFWATISNHSKRCDQGVWSIEYEYRIRQYS